MEAMVLRIKEYDMLIYVVRYDILRSFGAKCSANVDSSPSIHASYM
jgi:hypothetical protein